MSDLKGSWSEREDSLGKPDLTCLPNSPLSPQTNGSLVTASAPLSPVAVMNFLHWGETSVVTFHRKFHDKWEDLGGIRLHEVHELLPRIANYLRIDAYFSINSTGLGHSAIKKSGLTGLPLCSRTRERLRWLNALYVDFDFAHEDNRHENQSFLEDFQRAREKIGLPIPSLIAFSGRGFWALWRLASSSDRCTPVPAFPEKIELYQRVQQALVLRLKDLGADTACTDAARVMRVPDSINTKAHSSCSQVQFYWMCDELHTLPEIADLLDVRARKINLTGLPRDRTKDDAKVRAGLARWAKPLRGFLSLWKLRGHFVKGVRHNAAFVYTVLLRRNHVSDDGILEACRKLAASCRPQLREADIRDCISSTARDVRFSFERSISIAGIVRMLRITPDEKAQMPEWFNHDTRRRRDRIAARHAIIVVKLRQAECFTPDRNRWTPAREMSRILASEHGLVISHVTLTTDYRAIHAKFFTGTGSISDSQIGKFRGSKSPPSLSTTAAQNFPRQNDSRKQIHPKAEEQLTGHSDLRQSTTRNRTNGDSLVGEVKVMKADEKNLVMVPPDEALYAIPVSQKRSGSYLKEETEAKSSKNGSLKNHIESVWDCYDASRFLRIHPATVKRLARDKDLPGFRIGNRWRFRPSELDAWARSKVPSSHSLRRE